MTPDSNGGIVRRCKARRVHPMNCDYYVRCERDEGHPSEHRNDGGKWTDSHPWAIVNGRCVALEAARGR